MKPYSKVLVGVFGAALLAASSLALAQDARMYAGASIGTSTADVCGALPGGVRCDNEDTAFRLFGGYRFNRYLAVEIGYLDGGAVSISAPGASAKIATTGFDAMAIASLPMDEHFSLFVKAGVFTSSSKLTSTVVGLSADESATGPLLGMGVQYDFDKTTGLRLEWHRYMDVGGDTIGEVDADVMSLGLLFKF